MKGLVKFSVLTIIVLGFGTTAFASDSRGSVFADLIQVVRDNQIGVDGLDNPRHLRLSDDNRFLYVASADDNALAIFKIGPEFRLTFSQVFKNTPTNIGLEGANRIVVSQNSEFLYTQSYYDSAIGFYRLQKSGDYHYQGHLSDGIDYEKIFREPAGPPKALDTLKLLGAYDIAIDKIHRRLFVASTVSNSLTTFSLANTGKPVPQQIISDPQLASLKGAVAVALSADAGKLAVAGMEGNAVSIFSQSADGMLTILHTLDNEQSRNQQFSAPIASAFTDKGRFLYVANAGNNSLHIFQFHQSGQYLHFQSVDNLMPGLANFLSPSQIIFTKDEKKMLITAEQGNGVFRFERSEETYWRMTGVLHNKDFSGDLLRSPSSMVASADGCHLVISSALSDAISVFKLRAKMCQ